VSAVKKKRPTRDFRVYRGAQWQEQFEALLKYKQQFGHCNVPHTYEHDLALSRWVKRQRCQYKLKLDGKRTSMSSERQQKLDELGFVWDPRTALWANPAVWSFSNTNRGRATAMFPAALPRIHSLECG
jgi:hypothetical protein